MITEENWGTTLYTDATVRHEVTGNGRLEVWEPYGLVSAPMLRKNVELSKPVKAARLYVMPAVSMSSTSTASVSATTITTPAGRTTVTGSCTTHTTSPTC